MVLVGQANGQNEVTRTHVQPVEGFVGDVELLEGYLATLFNLGFVFAILRVLKFVGCAHTARFELYLGAEGPAG